MAKVSTGTRRELVLALGGRYRTVGIEEKGRILDEFVVLTGYHRKHAIRVLNGDDAPSTSPRCGRRRLYDEAVRETLIVLWEASDRVCGKRLKPLLAVLLPALERHGHLHLDAAVRDRVLTVSASTIDRVLAGARAATGGRRRRSRATPSVRRSVPVRTFADWGDPAPGFVEADLVAHSGESMAGSFAHSLVLTDIASGWTECVALLVREGSLVVDALARLHLTLPFPLRGIDTDNGSEFINDPLVTFCQRHGIEFTRSRPYRKNDQAWIEQKNGAVVRRLVGYGRLEGIAAGEALARLYSAARLFVRGSTWHWPMRKRGCCSSDASPLTRRRHTPSAPRRSTSWGSRTYAERTAAARPR